MSPMTILLIFTAMLLGALLIEPLANFLRLPFASLLVFVGFGASELLVRLGVDTGLRWYHFTDLILRVFLPILVYQAAFSLDLRQVMRNILPILLLAVPLFVAATLMIGLGLYLGIDHPTGFPWATALLAGAILSATDPTAVSGLLHRLGFQRAALLLEGESLFNDATAIVLFSVLLALASSPLHSADYGEAVLQFSRLFAGGLIFGALIGIVGVGLMFTFTGPIPCAVITIATIIFSVYLSESLFQVSAVMTVLSAGLITGEANRRFCHVAFLDTLWEFHAYIAQALIFLLVGATITIEMFRSQWLAMAIGIVIVLVVRGLVVYLIASPLCRGPAMPALSRGDGLILFWGGLRGAVCLALALSLPLELEGWYTVQSVAYGVVLFSLLVQGTTLEPMIRLLRWRTSSRQN